MNDVIQPAALPANLPRRILGAITSNIVLILGLAVLLVIGGSITLAWFDKVVPEAVVAMGGVALGYLGSAIQGDKAS